MRFNYAVLLHEDQLIAARSTSKGWKVINPRQLPSDKGRAVCVFIGGNGVIGTRVSLPVAREAEIRRAAPFAVEEELAADIADTHFALGARKDGSAERDVRIVSKEEMQAWTDVLQAHGLKKLGSLFGC